MNRIHLNTEAGSHKVNHGSKAIITNIKTLERYKIQIKFNFSLHLLITSRRFETKGSGKGWFIHILL